LAIANKLYAIEEKGKEVANENVSSPGADPGGGKRDFSHGQIFEIVIFSITWSYYINASQTF
jgi:hypothetical protein